MKIMLVTRVYPSHRPGGMPFVCQDRARALAALGHDVHVVTTFLSGQQRFNDNGPEVFHNYNSTMMKWSPDFARACQDHCQQWLPDIIHLDSFDRSQMWWIGQAKRTAITLHGFGWGAFLTGWNQFRSGGAPPKFGLADFREESKALAKADVVIGVSRHEYRMLRDEYGLANAKLVYNPIAPYFFSGLASNKPSGTYFLSAAVSGHKERGFDVVEQACRLAGVEVRFADKALRENMPISYDGAKAILLPTAYAQGFDLAICEARARGVAAIMSSTGSYLSEAEEFDRHCLPLDVDSLTKQIVQWVQPSPALVRSAAQVHRPEWHATRWLEAILG